MLNTQSQQQIFVKQLRQLLSGRRNTTRRSVTNSIVSCLGYYGEAFPTQTYLGSKAHVVRETACRSLKTLQGSILVIRNRGYKKTCQYWLTSEFLNNRHHFYDLIPALRQVNLLLLFSITSNVYSQNVTQYKELTGAKPRWGVSLFKYRNDEHSGYHFYEKDYGKETIIPLFFNNQSITIEKHQLCPKESVMSQQAIITLISQAYNLSIDQQEQLSRYSFEALEYARKELYRQNKQNSLTNAQSATSWFSAVASSFDKKASQPKTGRTMSYAAKKVVYGGTNNNHSYSTLGANPDNPDDPLNLSLEERVEFAQTQIDAFDAVLPEGDSILLQDQPRVRGGGFRSLADVMKGMAPNMKNRWKDLKKNPKDIPSLMNGFMVNLDDASNYTEGEDYEEHLNNISKDKTDPEGYKLVVRKRDYRGTARP